MRRFLPALLLLFPLPALALPALTVTVDGIPASGIIQKAHAACIPTIDGKSTRGENIRPTISWSEGPARTGTYAIIVTDPDVPADLSIANQDDLLIDSDMPRQTFYHLLQFNIAKNVLSLPGGPRPTGFGRGAANDVSKGADTISYGGPCPPWNDARRHHYHFRVVALDGRLALPEGAPARDVVAAMEGHILAEGEAVGTYALNPSLPDTEKVSPH